MKLAGVKSSNEKKGGRDTGIETVEQGGCQRASFRSLASVSVVHHMIAVRDA